MAEYTKLATGIVSLLVLIIVAVMIFWSVTENVIEVGTTDEVFDGYARYARSAATGANCTGITIELSDVPTGTDATNVTCFNKSNTGLGSPADKTLTYPAFALNGRNLIIAAGATTNFTQVNVSYTSEKTESAETTNDMFSTIVPLMVLIALVVVAGVIIAIISKFGQ